jgi:hypothetical protein
MGMCLIRDCPRPLFSRGYCQMHYTRMRRHGDPLLSRPSPIQPRPIAERFWEKVDRTGDCWLWTGSGDRYGHVRLNGKIVQAHRVAWELTNGPIPEGLQCLHTCDRPLCVNPEHLWLGTRSDNMLDMVAKGRKGGGRKGRRAVHPA